MLLQIKNSQINYKKEDFEEAIHFIEKQSEELIKENGNIIINNSKEKFKNIIIGILDLTIKLNIDINGGFLKEKLICGLINHGDIRYYGLAKKIDEILNPYYNIDNESEYLWIERILNQKCDFIPFYQGIRDNKSGEIYKYEALIRYNDGNKIITPNVFLDIAKKNNLLGVISVKMITKVIYEMTSHNSDISINLDGELGNDNIVKLILKTLEENKVTPDRLTIEVLETINGNKNNDNFKKILKNIKKLKSKGIHISIDDYGAGNSTILRILETNPDTVKIDGNLIKKLGNKKEYKKTLVVLKSIVEMVHGLGKKVVAEHIENEKIQKIIEKLGIDYSQGYLFSKPSRDIIKSID